MNPFFRFLTIFWLFLLAFAFPHTLRAGTATDHLSAELLAEEPVIDIAGVLKPATRKELNRVLQAFETDDREIVLITVVGSGNYGTSHNLGRLANRIFAARGMYHKKNALLLLIDTLNVRYQYIYSARFSKAGKKLIRFYISEHFAPMGRKRRYDKAARVIPGLAKVLWHKDSSAKPILTASTPAPSAFGDEQLQDIAHILSSGAKKQIRSMLADRIRQGQDIRVLIVRDFKRLAGRKTWAEFMKARFHEMGLDAKPNSILIVHDVSRKIVRIELGAGYGQAQRKRVADIVKIYTSALLANQIDAAHLKGLRTLLMTFPIVTGKHGSFNKKTRKTQEKGPKIPKLWLNVDQPVSDPTGILPPETIIKLRLLISDRAGKTDQITRVLIVPDYKDYAPPGKDRIAWMNDVFRQWKLNDKRNTILILHDVSAGKVLVKLGRGYSADDYKAAQQVIEHDYLPALKHGNMEKAHVAGLRRLLAMIDKSSASASGAPLIPWRYVFFLAIFAWGVVKIAESNRQTLVSALHAIRSPRAAVTRPAGKPTGIPAEKPTGSAWEKGLSRTERIKYGTVPQVRREPPQTCPRCGGPITVKTYEPPALYSRKRVYKSCTHCTWFTVEVPRRKR